ncbi:MAG: hypothetical protein DMF52_00895 [Acidobacteria bacterium]|nr:MAG: hypothetical protein DMF52_00895 [Acidobacteriota bacterium]
MRKHGVDFADAATIFDDPLAVTVPDEGTEESRFVTIGSDAQARVLVVVYVWRDVRIRIISARRASRSEWRQYEG